jgi:hypothetical protein
LLFLHFQFLSLSLSLSLSPLPLFGFFEALSHYTAQDDLELSILCLSCPSAGITVLCHHTQYNVVFLPLLWKGYQFTLSKSRRKLVLTSVDSPDPTRVVWPWKSPLPSQGFSFLWRVEMVLSDVQVHTSSRKLWAPMSILRWRPQRDCFFLGIRRSRRSPSLILIFKVKFLISSPLPNPILPHLCLPLQMILSVILKSLPMAHVLKASLTACGAFGRWMNL